VRAVACLAAICALAATGSAAARPAPGCPHVNGTVTYVRGGMTHAVSLSSCSDRTTGTAKPVRGLPDVVTRSPDGRWRFSFAGREVGASYAADGLALHATNAATGRSVTLGVMLVSSDYWTWCGATLVLTMGGDRVATSAKRLVAARAPDWKPRPLWRDPTRTFGSVDCAPDGRSVAVLTQRKSDDARFFSTRWQLWQVGLGGTRTRLDRPPAGMADESPHWSPDGGSLVFVRERNGYGRLMLLHGRTLFGPLAGLGYSLGYYGHHDWRVAWRA
jgi:hypothetical protein